MNISEEDLRAICSAAWQNGYIESEKVEMGFVVNPFSDWWAENNPISVAEREAANRQHEQAEHEGQNFAQPLKDDDFDHLPF